MIRRFVIRMVVYGLLLFQGLTHAEGEAQGPVGRMDLSGAQIVVRGQVASPLEQTAALVLVEEVEKRTALSWPIVSQWPTSQPVIVVMVANGPKFLGKRVPIQGIENQPEGYGLATRSTASGQPQIWIVGADAKGALSGVGKFLRSMDWRPGSIELARPLNLMTRPQSPIRGHQLGYRTTANSYDAWNVATYDQYIRELALFGVNAIENIPFQDTDSPLMPIPRQEMNQAMARICHRYGMAYWVWTPATVDLSEPSQRLRLLNEHEAFYQTCPYLGAVFFPGGDPGENPPQQVLPFLEEVAQRLAKHHPQATVWMSLQGFDALQIDYVFAWIHEHQPTWLRGLVGGPSSPPLPQMRKRLSQQYQLRDYPDITHTVRSQYPTVWIDPAFAFTTGREGPNPEPLYYSTIHHATAADTDGFITYSDGMHDDVNKIIWSALGWDPAADVREILVDYCRLHFGSQVAEQAADGLLALEQNWSGPLATNGGVTATLALWQNLDRQADELAGNWRWQLCQFKAHYEAYQRSRLLAETNYEEQANRALALAETGDPRQAIERAEDKLRQADTCCEPNLRAQILKLADALFASIGYQTSVSKYGASSPQRGAVLDFLDHPLNNRWWLEDEFNKIRKLTDIAAQRSQLKKIRTWEHPGPGSFYDDIGNVSKSPHVIRGEGLNTDPHQRRNPNPDFMWWDAGQSRYRPSWISKMDWPLGLQYEGVDPQATYRVRTTGYGQCLLRVNGVRVKPTLDGRGIGELKEFPLPPDLYAAGKIVLTFDLPDEPGINWRKASRLSEVWLIRDP